MNKLILQLVLFISFLFVVFTLTADQQFVPSSRISADTAVSFPVDI
jgi:hypothetical protein|tara:strand:- start:328 stop:465 length:138 start_codon:yes stop_codon:yes gene_type:complete